MLGEVASTETPHSCRRNFDSMPGEGCCDHFVTHKFRPIDQNRVVMRAEDTFGMESGVEALGVLQEEIMSFMGRHGCSLLKSMQVSKNILWPFFNQQYGSGGGVVAEWW